ncbi:MAG: uroporphyrinogen-III synthase [Bacteroidales bacterium]|nr:uroporphyrinogen-III synthase [Bacteroidales bacterium]
MKIDRILIAQPGVASANPHYANLIHKYNVKIDFKPFFSMVPLSVREFRAQKVNIPDYTAIVFTSKGTIDAFFKLCLEQRIKIPDSQKYFCTSENISYYLQKHIIYRKRKIFYGDGTFASVVKLAKAEKHKDDKFLLASPDHIYPEWISMFQETKLKFASAVVAKFVDNDLKDLNLNDYQIIAFYNALDITSLKNNFPNYKPGDTKFVAFGSGIRKAMTEAGLNYAIGGPTSEFPSLANALEKLIVEPDFKQTIMPAEKKPVVAKPAEPVKAKKVAEPKPVAPKVEVKKVAPKKAAVKPAVKKQVAKPTAKKVVVKPAAKKSAPAKKNTPKPATKKVAPKKAAPKPVAKKVVAKKPAAKKAIVKKAVKKQVTKVTSKKTVAKKVAVKKTVPSKSKTKKPVAKKAGKR